MKVAVCMLRSELARMDGGGESTRRLVEALRLAGVGELTIVSSYGDEPSHRAYARAPWSDARAASLTLRFCSAVTELARAHDLVVLVLPNPSFGLLADLLRPRIGKPVVVNYESHWNRLAEYGFSGDNFSPGALARLALLNGLTARAARASCERYVVSTATQKADLLRIGYPPERVRVIPNCTDTAVAPSARHGAGRIGYLGHFNASKGVDLLVRAMPLVRRTHPGVELHLAWSGSGGDYRRIARAIEHCEPGGRATVTKGRVDVPNFLASLDVLVLPYRSVTRTRIIPSVLLEALAVGVPVAVARCLPIEDVVQDRRTALLVPREDPGAVADAIVELLDSPAMAQQMREAQREAARARFSREVVGRAYAGMFEELA
jgi:glycosyltransferase involved in cell wall biosynthesis